MIDCEIQDWIFKMIFRLWAIMNQPFQSDMTTRYWKVKSYKYTVNPACLANKLWIDPKIGNMLAKGVYMHDTYIKKLISLFNSMWPLPTKPAISVENYFQIWCWKMLKFKPLKWCITCHICSKFHWSKSIFLLNISFFSPIDFLHVHQHVFQNSVLVTYCMFC